jgi:hypothetical protein
MRLNLSLKSGFEGCNLLVEVIEQSFLNLIVHVLKPKISAMLFGSFRESHDKSVVEDSIVAGDDVLKSSRLSIGLIPYRG